MHTKCYPIILCPRPGRTTTDAAMLYILRGLVMTPQSITGMNPKQTGEVKHMCWVASSGTRHRLYMLPSWREGSITHCQQRRQQHCKYCNVSPWHSNADDWIINRSSVSDRNTLETITSATWLLKAYLSDDRVARSLIDFAVAARLRATPVYINIMWHLLDRWLPQPNRPGQMGWGN